MIRNEEGYVKCINAQGRVVWVGDHIATNENRMKKIGLSLAPEPIKLEPLIIGKVDDNVQIDTIVEVLPDCPPIEESKVIAENTPKKRGRKPKNK